MRRKKWTCKSINNLGALTPRLRLAARRTSRARAQHHPARPAREPWTSADYVGFDLAREVQSHYTRELLGIDFASAEDGAGWLAFLRSLMARGLAGETSGMPGGRRSSVGLPGVMLRRLGRTCRA